MYIYIYISTHVCKSMHVPTCIYIYVYICIKIPKAQDEGYSGGLGRPRKVPPRPVFAGSSVASDAAGAARWKEPGHRRPPGRPGS